MSNYTKSTNFATKDNLSPGNPLKIVKGTEIDTEFNNIQTAVGTKTDNASANITGGSITGITDLAVADGGTGASTATAALNNLLPTQTGNANKYLQTDGTNATWDAVSLSTSDITGTLPVANGGTGVTSSTGTGNVVLSNSPTLVTPALGTPSALVGTNITGTASGLTAGNVTTNANLTGGVTSVGNATTVVTNANLTGAVTSVGNATSLGSFTSSQLATALTDETGSGANVFATSPTLVTPILGTPTSATLTNATGLPISTGVSGLGTGVATFLATPSSANLASAITDETGSGSLVFATSPTLVTPILGTPTSGTLTNATGLPISTGVAGLGTGVATFLATPSSANLAAALTDETGTGANVFATSPTLVTPILGTPTSATLTNATGLPLTTGVTGTLPVANGGTGTATPSIVAGTNVTVTGTWPNQTIAASGGGGSGTVTSVAATVPSLFSITGSPITSSGTLAMTYSGTALPVANGGTGVTTSTGSGNNVLSTSPTLVTPTLGVATATSLQGIIGNVTPAAGAFTTVDASGAVTLSGGTANGVTYLNGSKVLTSGSALVFDGTNLGVGATSPTNRIDLGFTDTTIGWYLSASYSAGITFNSSARSMTLATKSGDDTDFIAFKTGISSAERVRIDRLGNVGIGTSSPAEKLHISNGASTCQIRIAGQSRNMYLGQDATGAIVYSDGAVPMLFYTNAIERARITAAGELLLTGLTSPITSGILCIASNLNNNNPVVLKNTTTQGAGQNFAVFTNSSNTQAGAIQHSGSTSVTYSTSSDARLKTDLGVSISTDVIDDTIIHNFEWKEDKQIDRGVFAQEAYQVKPSAVSVGNDEITEDGNLAKPWGVDYSKYVPDLIVYAQQLKKQVQEQQAIVESLTARLDAANL